MSNTLQDRLSEIRERCEAEGLTAAPWVADIMYAEGNPASGAYAKRIIQGKPPLQRWFEVGACYAEDAQFIAHAREDIPFLLEQIVANDLCFEQLRALCEADFEVPRHRGDRVVVDAAEILALLPSTTPDSTDLSGPHSCDGPCCEKVSGKYCADDECNCGAVGNHAACPKSPGCIGGVNHGGICRPTPDSEVKR